MEFEFTKEQQKFRHSVREFAEKVVKPRGAELENGEFPAWLWQEYKNTGFLRRTVPEEYGGDGAPFMDMVIMLEELAKVNFTAAAYLQVGANFPIEFIGRLGSKRLREKYLPSIVNGEALIVQGLSEPHAGSALTDLSSTAELQGKNYLVNASKHYITFGYAATAMATFVRFHPDSKGAKGIGAIIVDKETPGYKVVRKQPNLAAPNGSEAVMKLKDCVVPEENVLVLGERDSSQGFVKLMNGYNSQRVGNASICLGVAQHALGLAINHAKRRSQFGRPICEFQTIQNYVVDMATKIESARWLIYKAALNAERSSHGLPTGNDSSFAKLVANQMVFEVTDRALQVFGGAGYVGNSTIGKLFLFARGESIAGGTVEMQKNLLASQIFGRKFDQRAG